MGKSLPYPTETVVLVGGMEAASPSDEKKEVGRAMRTTPRRENSEAY